MTDIITTKRELAEYLAEHDPEMLEIFKEFAREFGPAVTVAYICASDMASPAPAKTGKRQDTRN